MKTSTIISINSSSRPRRRYRSLLALAILGLASPLWAQPTIVTQPQDQTVPLGATATFNVEATGTEPLTYQWRSYSNMRSFTNIPGATSATQMLPNAQPTVRRFGVVVSDSSGSVTSRLARLKVVLPPTITMQPVDQAGPLGGTTIFEVTATGEAPLDYQWRFNDMDLAGETSSQLMLANLQSDQEGPYTVVVSNFGGAVTSQVATLTIFDTELHADPGFLSWPMTTEEYVVQAADSIQGPWNLWQQPITQGEGSNWMNIAMNDSARFFRLVLGRQFMDDFNDGNADGWHFFHGQACQRDQTTLTTSNGAYRIEYQQQPGQPFCAMFTPPGAFFSPLDPLDQSVIFSNMVVSVDITDWSREPYLSIAFRAEFESQEDPRLITLTSGYLAGVEVYNETRPSQSVLWLERVNYGYRSVGIPFMSLSKDYRLQLSVVGNQFTLRLFELSDPPNLIGMLTATDNTLGQGVVALIYQGGRSANPNDLESGSITIDNFKFTGTTP